MSVLNTRRAFVATASAAALMAASRAPWAQSLPKVLVTKDPTCSRAGR